MSLIIQLNNQLKFALKYTCTHLATCLSKNNNTFDEYLRCLYTDRCCERHNVKTKHQEGFW